LPLSAGLQPLLNAGGTEPDNRFNQLSLTGTTTAEGPASFAVVCEHHAEPELAASGLVGAGRSDQPGGNVNTTLAWLGITSRPIPKLTLQADIVTRTATTRRPSRPAHGGLWSITNSSC
jgi:hypothetical protein